METEKPYAAGDALDDVRTARERLMKRVQAPPYYFPTLGVAVGVAVAAQAVDTYVALTAGMLSFAACMLLLVHYRAVAGVWTARQAERGSMDPVMKTFAVVLVCLHLFAIGARLFGLSAWWGVPLGAMAFAATVVVGRVVSKRQLSALWSGPAPTGSR